MDLGERLRCVNFASAETSYLKRKMEKFDNKYRVATARAFWHDYEGGMYFVTICTAGRAHFFGEIENAKMVLSEIGKVAHESFSQVSANYPYVQIPMFVIMPNHVHAIVCLNVDECEKDTGRSPVSFSSSGVTRSKNPMLSQSLGGIIRGIKARISRSARQMNVPFGWQSRFYDHIIRSRESLNNIAQYIENNVAQWDFDELNN